MIYIFIFINQHGYIGSFWVPKILSPAIYCLWATPSPGMGTEHIEWHFCGKVKNCSLSWKNKGTTLGFSLVICVGAVSCQVVNSLIDKVTASEEQKFSINYWVSHAFKGGWQLWSTTARDLLAGALRKAMPLLLIHRHCTENEAIQYSATDHQ